MGSHLDSEELMRMQGSGASIERTRVSCPCHMTYRAWPMQVGTESLNMRQAMKIMKEQAAAMAVQAQQQAQEAAAQKAHAEASLTTANADLAKERLKFADLQVPYMRLLTKRALPAGIVD